MGILEFINSLAGLLSAIGTLCLGMTAVASHLKGKKGDAVKQTKGFRTWSSLLGVVLLAISAGIFITRALTEPQAMNSRLTTEAWEAFNKSDFDTAIARAESCINEFKGAADKEQERLDKNHFPAPPTGTVSESDKKVIGARGLLNDVATCFFIKGRSAENLERRGDAKAAYQEASKYTYARCWDPKGWFWSPSEAALDRLRSFK